MIGRDGYLGKLFYKLKHGTAYLSYGRQIVSSWAVNYANRLDSDTIRILDIGMGTGIDLLNIKRGSPSKNVNLFGIECYEPNIEKAKQNGIAVYPMNIENEAISVA